MTNELQSCRIPTGRISAAFARIESLLRGRLQEARLFYRNGGIVICGAANSYHTKQLAQHVVMNEFSLPIVANEICVRPVVGGPGEATPPPKLMYESKPHSRLPRQKRLGTIKDSLTALRLIVEQLPNAVIATDPHGTIQVWNPAATELFGFLQAEAIGQNVNIIIPEAVRDAHRLGFENAMTKGYAIYGGRAVTMRPIRKSGERCFVEFSFSVLRDRDGDILGAMATARRAVAAAP